MSRHHDGMDGIHSSGTDRLQPLPMDIHENGNRLDVLWEIVDARLTRLSRVGIADIIHHRPTALDELEESNLFDLYLDAIILEAEEDFVALIEEILMVRSHPDTLPDSAREVIKSRLAARLNKVYKE